MIGAYCSPSFFHQIGRVEGRLLDLSESRLTVFEALFHRPALGCCLGICASQASSRTSPEPVASTERCGAPVVPPRPRQPRPQRSRSPVRRLAQSTPGWQPIVLGHSQNERALVSLQAFEEVIKLVGHGRASTRNGSGGPEDMHLPQAGTDYPLRISQASAIVTSMSVEFAYRFKQDVPRSSLRDLDDVVLLR